MEEASGDPIFQELVGGNLTQLLLTQTNSTDSQNGTAQQPLPKQNNTSDDLISIEDELKPALVTAYENDTSPEPSLLSAKCINIFGCPTTENRFLLCLASSV